MVLRREAGEASAVIAIGQPSHAWLSGQLASAWGNERFGAVEPREEVCLAAEQHDAGMAAWDAAPELNPATGLPYSFTEMPVATHVELWSRAWELVLPQSRYAALLVSMHGTALYEMRDLAKLAPAEAALARAYLAEQRQIQERLAATLPDASAVGRNQRLIWTWDALSLALCLDWPPFTLGRVPLAGGGRADVVLTPADGERVVAVDPWPFVAQRVAVRCEGRRLAGRFDDSAAMRAALAVAPWVELSFELVPGAA